MSYDYGTTFTQVSDRFRLPGDHAGEEGVAIISQFYHSPADNKRVGTSSSRLALVATAANAVPSSSPSVSVRGRGQGCPVEQPRLLLDRPGLQAALQALRPAAAQPQGQPSSGLRRLPPQQAGEGRWDGLTHF